MIATHLRPAVSLVTPRSASNHADTPRSVASITELERDRGPSLTCCF